MALSEGLDPEQEDRALTQLARLYISELNDTLAAARLWEEAAISAPPETWKEFRDTAIKLTNWRDNDPKKALLQSGAAVGTADNVSHPADILGLMLAQSEVSIPTQLDSQASQDVFTFYTNFVTKQVLSAITLSTIFAEFRFTSYSIF